MLVGTAIPVCIGGFIGEFGVGGGLGGLGGVVVPPDIIPIKIVDICCPIDEFGFILLCSNFNFTVCVAVLLYTNEQPKLLNPFIILFVKFVFTPGTFGVGGGGGAQGGNC